VDELIVRDEDADVRSAVGFGVEEHEVARLEILLFDLLPDLELLLDLARQRDAVLREHPLYEPAAVKPRRIAAAAAIRCSSEAERRRDQCVDRSRRRAKRTRGR
jgi:hypothetical protein